MKTVSIRLTEDEVAALEATQHGYYGKWNQTKVLRAALYAFWKAQGIDPREMRKKRIEALRVAKNDKYLGQVEDLLCLTEDLAGGM
jgi:hypothetical protein